jgi:isopentenyl-diphosphate Delta-isomerase
MIHIPIDVLDEEGVFTGQVSNIQEVHDKGFWHRTAHLWIVNAEGQILLQRRSGHVVNHPNCLDISTSGHVDSGETGLQAAVREASEELGLTVNPNEIVRIKELKNYGEDACENKFNFEFVDILILKKDIQVSDLVLDPHEVSDVMYVSLEDFEVMVLGRDAVLSPHWIEYEIVIDYLKNNL